ncbi:MAG: cobyric acid synthase [Microcella sp.]|uniref:type 1 glutamine amidotransferase n=1 Tax=Microcella sp. TaxID=1913979 RepID=UPI0024C894A3|nr:cobyric acid synthase [Microcella sp.]UYN84147.1 MAG: cobyric acid synthase [Microcella sp.]
MTALRILHLYPHELGINGDAGNVLALRRRLEWRGIEAEVLLCGTGDPLPVDVDLVHIGSGPASARDAVLPDALRHRDALAAWADDGVPMIGIGAGFHLLSRSIETRDGSRRAALDVLPVVIRDRERRAVGEVLAEPSGGHRMAGYLNHGASVMRDDGVPLATLDHRSRSSAIHDDADRYEGVRIGSRIGTHLHGPILPMNPFIADELLAGALARRGETLPDRDERTVAADEHARLSRAAIARRLGAAGVEV